jgi:hypothetical protein
MTTKKLLTLLKNLRQDRAEVLSFLHDPANADAVEVEGRWKVHQISRLLVFVSGETIYYKEYGKERDAKHALGRIQNTPKFALTIIGELAKQDIKRGG